MMEYYMRNKTSPFYIGGFATLADWHYYLYGMCLKIICYKKSQIPPVIGLRNIYPEPTLNIIGTYRTKKKSGVTIKIVVADETHFVRLVSVN